MTYNDIPGWMDFEALYDAQVAEAKDGDTFVEIGCWLGRSTVYLADAIKRSGKKITLYAIDNFSGVTLPPGSAMNQPVNGANLLGEFLANLVACDVRRFVKVLVSDSAAAAEKFADGSVDFVFIDGDHSYEAVARDITAWRGKIKPGGAIAGHDRVREGVDRAVREAFGRYMTSGPLAWVVTL
jgi:predicted O-methyltransferase YrrM